MAKKGKDLNPADAHRKLLRKKELKKNKEDKKKKDVLAANHREALRLAEELASLGKVEKDGTLDKIGKTRKDKIQQRLDEINDSRRAVGLAAVNVASVSSKPKDDVPMKWYHPTFNPHGPKKPRKEIKSGGSSDSESNSSDETDSTDSDESSENDGSLAKPLDYSNLPIPQGKPSLDAQFYHNLDLPERRLEIKPTIQNLDYLNNPLLPIPPLSVSQLPQMPFVPQFYTNSQIMQSQQLQPHGLFPASSAQAPSYQFPPQYHFSAPVYYNVAHRSELPSSTKTSTSAKEAAETAEPQKPVNRPSIISVEPQMRDLQKELTKFVPTALLKKRGKVGGVVVGGGNGAAAGAIKSRK
ncbi:hypothetical protein HDU82_001279, partial [Entophlyctis luteolus]